MLKIGQHNRLKVGRLVDFGVYLIADDKTEILLPAKYISSPLQPGDMVDVFVYTDSEDRLIATTEQPLAEVGQFAFLEVKAVNRIGAFLDWGLVKDLLVPFREQKSTMRVGGIYPVYVYLDDASKRVVASAKIEKFIGNLIPDYSRGTQVEATAWRRTPIGMQCIVDNCHYGILYDNQTFSDIEPGMKFDAWVNKVRNDGKIDLTLNAPHSGRTRTDELAQAILLRINESGGSIPFSDKSTPEEIRAEFHCSKRDFKQAVGHLLKDKVITLSENKIVLSQIFRQCPNNF